MVNNPVCSSQKGQGDANDVWRVEVVGGSEGDPVLTVTSKIKFYHYFLKVVGPPNSRDPLQEYNSDVTKKFVAVSFAA